MVYKNVDQGLFIKLRIKLSLRKIARKNSDEDGAFKHVPRLFINIHIFFRIIRLWWVLLKNIVKIITRI